MIERLMAIGFNEGAATFLAGEIAAERKALSKIEFTAQIDLRYVPKMNAQYEGEKDGSDDREDV